MKIDIKQDCGNSPKMNFVKEWNIAFAKQDFEFLQQHVSDDVVWKIVGDQTIKGKTKFLQALEDMTDSKVSELILHRILSHGKSAACHGTLILTNRKKFAFSEFYDFTTAKGDQVKQITTYVNVL